MAAGNGLADVALQVQKPRRRRVAFADLDDLELLEETGKMLWPQFEKQTKNVGFRIAFAPYSLQKYYVGKEEEATSEHQQYWLNQLEPWLLGALCIRCE